MSKRARKSTESGSKSPPRSSRQAISEASSTETSRQESAQGDSLSASPNGPSALRWYAKRGNQVLLLFAALISLGLGWVFADYYVARPIGIRPTYVGRTTCAECHADQIEAFTGSHHDLAMDVANDLTVLGDFNEAVLEHDGLQTRFFRKESQFWVQTEGPNGESAEFQVSHVFGVHPLQQYIVELNRPTDLPENCITKAQVLRASWDVEKGEWFFLRPPDVDERIEPGDPLHWTGITQTWNTSCADCHSTNVVKGFDTTLVDYRTTFSEIDVSCEACHGPGSLHVELANAGGMFWDRRYGTGIVAFPKAEPRKEIETCARCHSRRSVLDETALPGEPFCNAFACELPSPGIYYPDGQILDEDFEFGSFTQSKMYHNKIRCSDCHDPHTARLRFNGNAVCTSCHQHSPSKYDVPAHHHHKPDSPGAQCVNCHMPESFYMEVDGRRDHSIRIPRPDLSVSLQTPNACTQCHISATKLSEPTVAELGRYQDWLVAAREGNEQVATELARLDQWAADKMVEWYGVKDRPSFAPLLANAWTTNGWEADRDFERKLVQLTTRPDTPVIIRAAALQSMAQSGSPESLDGAVARLSDPEPMIVAAALVRVQLGIQESYSLLGEPGGFDRVARLVEPVAELLTHPSRWVRNEAARAIAMLGPDRTRFMNREQAVEFDAALTGLEESLRLHGDRAGSQLGLGLLYEDLARFDEAIDAYRLGIVVEPNAVGPRSNLANLLERQADAARSELQQAAQFVQRRGGQLNQQETQELEALAATEHKLREEVAGLRRDELPLLELDAARAPELAALQYRLGMLLHLNDRDADAAVALARAYELEPSRDDYLFALAVLRKEQGEWLQVRDLSKQLLERDASNPYYSALLREAETALKQLQSGE